MSFITNVVDRMMLDYGAGIMERREALKQANIEAHMRRNQTTPPEKKMIPGMRYEETPVMGIYSWHGADKMYQEYLRQKAERS